MPAGRATTSAARTSPSTPSATPSTSPASRFADGRTVTVKGDWATATRTRAGSCARSSRPPASASRRCSGRACSYHDDHFHLDLAHHDRRGTSRYCRPMPDGAPPRRAAGRRLARSPRGGFLDWGRTGSISSGGRGSDPDIGELLGEMPPDVAAELADPFGASSYAGD